MTKAYHFIGIGGIGMSGLAHILIDCGFKVSGEDLKETLITEQLRKRGAYLTSKISGRPIVVYSSAILSDHPSFVYAKELGLPLMHRSDLLKQLMAKKCRLLVAGTHGKTSTSALLAHVLSTVGLDPSFAIGGMVPSLGGNGRHAAGDYFVAEADESDGSFLSYTGEGAIITNIESEHLDYWKTEQKLIEGFSVFAQKITDPDLLFWCGDDFTMKRFKLPGFSYGKEADVSLRMTEFSQNENGIKFSATFKEKSLFDLYVPVLGEHQALNALAACGLALQLGVKESEVREAFTTFKGVSRRLEKKGEVKGITLYDDYAHHPTEIHQMLSALKAAVGKKRLVAVFQPHRYTRTADLIERFASSFSASDVCVITDVYAAGELPIKGISGESLFRKICVPQENYYFSKQELPHALRRLLKHQDVIVTIGAGDITRLGEELMEMLL